MSVCLFAEQIQREASPNYTNLMVMNGDEIICDCELKNLIGVDIEFCNDDGRSFLWFVCNDGAKREIQLLNFGDKSERNWLPVVRLCFDLFEGEQQQQPQNSCGSVMSLCADSFMIYSCLLKGEKFAKLRLIKEKINSFVGGSRWSQLKEIVITREAINLHAICLIVMTLFVH